MKEWGFGEADFADQQFIALDDVVAGPAAGAVEVVVAYFHSRPQCGQRMHREPDGVQAEVAVAGVLRIGTASKALWRRRGWMAVSRPQAYLDIAELAEAFREFLFEVSRMSFTRDISCMGYKVGWGEGRICGRGLAGFLILVREVIAGAPYKRLADRVAAGRCGLRKMKNIRMISLQRVFCRPFKGVRVVE